MGQIGVVLDTNVVVSALGFGGPPLEALLRSLEDDVRLLASEETLGELERVMTYDHLPFTSADRVQLLSILSREADLVEPDATLAVVRDSDDDKFLELALEGRADYVVSGDQDLQSLESFDGVEIVSPDEFVAVLE